MGNRSLARTLALIGVAAVFMAGCTAKTTTPTKKVEVKSPYIIGAILSVTGANAPLGEAEKKALELEIGIINKAGGANGHQLELALEDDESDTAKAVAAANKLIKVDKVAAIIGGSGTGTSMGIKPIVTASKIPYISMAAGDVITAPDTKWVFRAPGKNSLAADKALEYIEKTLKVKKLAVLYDSNPFGQDGINMITQSAPKRGLTIVAQEKYETAAADVTAQLTNIKASNPDVVVVWGTNPMPAKAAATMKQLGITVPYVGSHGIANAKFIELAADSANGVVFPAGKLILPAAITNAAQKKAVDAFIKGYKAKYASETPNTFAGHAYDALYILKDALATAGSNPTALRTAIEKTRGFAGPDGIYKYSATNHDGLATTDFVMVKIEAGKWTLVK